MSTGFSPRWKEAGIPSGLRFGAAATRTGLATPFTASTAQRPGEIVQADTTPLDVMAVFDDEVLGRPELTITLDVATRMPGTARATASRSRKTRLSSRSACSTR